MEFMERGLFLKLFNRDGYVLDFSTAGFDAFTLESVGIALCKKYGESKGRSLLAFVHEADEQKVNKLLFDLFKYYETVYPYFEQETNEEASCYPWERKYTQEYRKCKTIIEKIDSSQYIQSAAQTIKDAFGSDYINSQVETLLSMQQQNPTEAIGKAKELIESCCETILEKNGITPNKDWKLNNLVDETMKLLEVTPQHIPDTAKEASAIKAILGSLKGIASNIAIIRNAYGSGHGKSASYKGLEERHAKLAVGTSLILVNFLWDSYLRQTKQNGNQA